MGPAFTRFDGKGLSLSKERASELQAFRKLWDRAIKMKFRKRCHPCHRAIPVADVLAPKLPLDPQHVRTARMRGRGVDRRERQKAADRIKVPRFHRMGEGRRTLTFTKHTQTTKHKHMEVEHGS